MGRGEVYQPLCFVLFWPVPMILIGGQIFFLLGRLQKESPPIPINIFFLTNAATVCSIVLGNSQVPQNGFMKKPLIHWGGAPVKQRRPQGPRARPQRTARPGMGRLQRRPDNPRKVKPQS